MASVLARVVRSKLKQGAAAAGMAVSPACCMWGCEQLMYGVELWAGRGCSATRWWSQRARRHFRDG